MQADFAWHQCGEYVHVDEWEEHTETCAPVFCPASTTVAGDPWHGCSLPPDHDGRRHQFTRRLYGAYPELGIATPGKPDVGERHDG